MFKHVVLFQLPKSWKVPPHQEEDWRRHGLRPVAPEEEHTDGMVSPFDPDQAPPPQEWAMTHEASKRVLWMYGSEDKMVPGSVVTREWKKLIARLEAESERKIKGKEKKELKESVKASLLPKAFVKASRTRGYLDPVEGWVVVEASSAKKAEQALSGVRHVLGTLPATPLPQDNIGEILTLWIQGKQLPEGLEIGQDCDLKDPFEGGGAIKCVKQDLSSSEVQDHIKAGKKVSKLALVYQERLHFSMSEDGVLSKIKIEGVESDMDSPTPDAGADPASKLDQDMTYMVLEFTAWFEKLREWFDIERPEADE